MVTSTRLRIVSIGDKPMDTALFTASFDTAPLRNARSVSTMMSRTMFDSARRCTKQFSVRWSENSFGTLRTTSTYESHKSKQHKTLSL